MLPRGPWVRQKGAEAARRRGRAHSALAPAQAQSTRLGMLRELVPKAARFAVRVNPTNPLTEPATVEALGHRDPIDLTRTLEGAKHRI